MIICVHIPKCAGTTFRHYLATFYGPRLWLNYGGAFTRVDGQSAQIPPGTECIHGHFLADAFTDRFAGASLVTWVRDPVERVISNYHHFLRSPDMRDDTCRRLIEERLTLLQFAELDWMRNTMRRYFAGLAVDDFAMIGISERFDPSLRAMAAKFGWPRPDVQEPVNINPARLAPEYAIGPRDREAIAALNRDDQLLYTDSIRLAKSQGWL